MKSLTVSQVTHYVKETLEYEDGLADIWIVGEVTAVKHYRLGSQIYFTLSDTQSQISCVIFQSFIKNVKFDLKNGQKVCARGSIRVYQKRGTFNFQVVTMLPVGDGDLALAFERLKATLSSEGLFDPIHKQPIPLYPDRVGIVSAPGSAALADFLTICHTLAPHLKLVFSPAVVQGPEAATSIMSALDVFESHTPVAVVVVMRGGGSPEDLACFNDERLVRRLFAFPLPLISAVGHEIDYSLTDFVSDMRLPTPSAAAQAIGQPFEHARHTLMHTLDMMGQTMAQHLAETGNHVGSMLDQMNRNMVVRIEKNKNLLDRSLARLELANPLHKLRQGFSICKHSGTSETVRSIHQISPEDELDVRFKDGTCTAKVVQTHEY